MFYYPILLQDKAKIEWYMMKQHTFLCLIVVFDYMARLFFALHIDFRETFFWIKNKHRFKF